MRTIYLIFVIYTIVYFVGVLWFIFAYELHELYLRYEINHNEKFFYIENGLDQIISDHSKILVIAMYFSFTSLSTVGFGDYYPKSNVERLVCALMLLSGVIVFTVIIGIFNNILDKFSVLNSDLDEGD